MPQVYRTNFRTPPRPPAPPVGPFSGKHPIHWACGGTFSGNGRAFTGCMDIWWMVGEGGRMGRRSYVPEELARGPFTVAQAEAVGVTRKRLQGRGWRRVARGWYVWAGLGWRPDLELAVVLPSLPPGAAFAGATAARIHGLDSPAGSKPEVVVPYGSGVSARAALIVRHARLGTMDVTSGGACRSRHRSARASTSPGGSRSWRRLSRSTWRSMRDWSSSAISAST
jgi:hypothetical protein